MSEPTCPHALPQAASQLHGICIFCYRDRLAAARAEIRKLTDALSYVHTETLLDRPNLAAIRDRAAASLAAPPYGSVAEREKA